MFAYCLNQPTRYSDVSGFAPKINDADLIAMGGVAGELALLTLIDKVIDSYKEWLASKKKPVNLPSWKKLTVNKDHISSGHMPGGNRNPDDTKSVFYGVTAAQMMKIVQEAYNNSSKIATIGDRIKLQGYSSIYGKVIELWINISDYILETAYPIN